MDRPLDTTPPQSTAASGRVMWFSADRVQVEVGRRIIPTEVVLDIGCGLRPQTYFRPKVHLCLEPHGEYVERLRQWFASAPGVTVFQATAEEFLPRLPDRSVDTVFALDLIEHLTRADGERLLAQCQRLARQQVVVFTPLGFMPQDYDEGDRDGWGLHGARWQRHLSGWTPEDFGEEWSFVACRDFHETNGKGESFEGRHGAFWAIRTLDRWPRVTVVSRDLRPVPTPLAEAADAICGGYPAHRLQVLARHPFDPYDRLRSQGLVPAALPQLPAAAPAALPLPHGRRRMHYPNLLRCTLKIRRALAATESPLVVAVAGPGPEFPAAVLAARRTARKLLVCIPESSALDGRGMSRSIGRADLIWAPEPRLAEECAARFPGVPVVCGTTCDLRGAVERLGLRD